MDEGQYSAPATASLAGENVNPKSTLFFRSCAQSSLGGLILRVDSSGTDPFPIAGGMSPDNSLSGVTLALTLEPGAKTPKKRTKFTLGGGTKAVSFLRSCTPVSTAKGLVILDEAYAEFSGESMISAAPRYPNLLVVRTLSKAFGLAGLRIGYAVGNREVVSEVEKSRGPFKVNALAETAAVAALTEDLNWVNQHVKIAIENRDRFASMLRNEGFAPLPSSANFVLVPVPDARKAASTMRERGVAVRPFPGIPRVGDGLRISIGTWPMMEAALAALREAAQ